MLITTMFAKIIVMQQLVAVFLLCCSLPAFSQESLLKTGSSFPDIIINQISNAPVKEFYLNKEKDNKFYILNFWGTWCSPCIPEMDTLAILQKANADKIKVIAISDDNEERKAKYLKNKPSSIWLATDTNYTLYNMLNLAFVGQSAIISPDKKIVALVRTDSINQHLIDRLVKGEAVSMSAGIKEAKIVAGEEAFGVDSLLQHSFTLSGYKTGHRSMSRRYFTGPYQHRRLTWINVSIAALYKSAYAIKSYQAQELYEDGLTEKEVADYENKQNLYCVDLLVTPGQQKELFTALQQYLRQHLPIKARPATRIMDVYVLKQQPGSSYVWKPSTIAQSSMGFSGRGYDGSRVSLKDFAEDYLTNELGLPVVDATGLNGLYDIKTTVDQRNRAGILESIGRLGLIVEKQQREMPVIVYYR